jgi:eukaryotic-like serine/threonine-protein kinase
MPYLPEQIVNKRYRIASLLGQGPAGAVYHAWDIHDEIEVALKEYLDPDIDVQRRFRAEARRLSQLSHPQLPAVRDHFALEGIGQYLVSDYVPGASLQELLEQYGPLPADDVVAWLQAAAEPLDYLHESGSSHLDVKPANLRLTPAGELFLVDSGLPGLGIAPGTRGYAAPEQEKQSDETGRASDIYSLGATLYTLLTGKVPPGALQRESGLEELIPAREVNADIAPYLSLVANRAMSLRPDARYESVLDFARALERPGSKNVIAEQPRRTEAQLVMGPARRLPHRARRSVHQRTMYGLLGLLLLILLIGAGVLAWGPGALVEGEEAQAAATATTQAQVIAALTAVAPTATATSEPTPEPTATPAPFTTKTGSRMLFVPGGLFRLGNDEGNADERPSRMVRLDPFYIDETEVTNRAYAQCVAEGGCTPPVSSSSAFNRDYYGGGQFSDYPVIYVNWEQARQFCEWRDARLPSEAEWERAASFDPERGVKTVYPWGDEFAGDLLNYCDSSCSAEFRDTTFNDGYRDVAPVGSYPDGRSIVGAYDMLGNVMEWTNDWYDRNYYANASDTNPLGPTDGFSKSVRGGSWLSDRQQLSVTARTFYETTAARSNIGFRCAMAER